MAASSSISSPAWHALERLPAWTGLDAANSRIPDGVLSTDPATGRFAVAAAATGARCAACASRESCPSRCRRVELRVVPLPLPSRRRAAAAAASADPARHAVLSLPPPSAAAPSFEAVRVEVSPDGGRVLLQGSHDLAVADLPQSLARAAAAAGSEADPDGARLAAAAAAAGTLRLRSVLAAPAGLRAARWHPWSPAHVAALAADNVWRLYSTVAPSADGAPERVLDLRRAAASARLDLVDFAWGSFAPGSSWDRLSVYFVAASGAFFVAGPLLPVGGADLPPDFVRELEPPGIRGRRVDENGGRIASDYAFRDGEDCNDDGDDDDDGIDDRGRDGYAVHSAMEEDGEDDEDDDADFPRGVVHTPLRTVDQMCAVGPRTWLQQNVSAVHDGPVVRHMARPQTATAAVHVLGPLATDERGDGELDDGYSDSDDGDAVLCTHSMSALWPLVLVAVRASGRVDVALSLRGVAPNATVGDTDDSFVIFDRVELAAGDGGVAPLEYARVVESGMQLFVSHARGVHVLSVGAWHQRLRMQLQQSAGAAVDGALGLPRTGVRAALRVEGEATRVVGCDAVSGERVLAVLSDGRGVVLQRLEEYMFALPGLEAAAAGGGSGRSPGATAASRVTVLEEVLSALSAAAVPVHVVPEDFDRADARSVQKFAACIEALQGRYVDAMEKAEATLRARSIELERLAEKQRMDVAALLARMEAQGEQLRGLLARLVRREAAAAALRERLERGAQVVELCVEERTPARRELLEALQRLQRDTAALNLRLRRVHDVLRGRSRSRASTSRRRRFPSEENPGGDFMDDSVDSGDLNDEGVDEVADFRRPWTPTSPSRAAPSGGSADILRRLDRLSEQIDANRAAARALQGSRRLE